MTTPVHGMIPGGSVAEALVGVMPLFGSRWLAILRSVDSARALADMKRVLEFHRLPYDVIHGNICLPRNALQQAVSERLFTGFDEVWIVDGGPPAFDLVALPRATSDGVDFALEVPEELPCAMEQTACVLIVGDGCGLNYATTSLQLQQELAKTGP